MRYLVLCHEGAPMAVDISAGPLRKIILDHPDDDVDLWSVWQVQPAGSMQPPFEITEQFALTWAMEFPIGDPLPAFVSEHVQRRRAA